MPNLFASRPLQLGALVVSVLLWRVLETGVDVRSLQRYRAGAQRKDGGSSVALTCLLVIGVLGGVLLAIKLPATAITSGRSVVFWVGIALGYAGIALRLYAIRTLGAYFTTMVAISSAQTVVETGPYRLIRHPSYTGLLLSLLGFGLSGYLNWLSLLVVMFCALLGLGYRMYVEERVLQAQLGQPYQAYMRRTKRLIPYVF